MKKKDKVNLFRQSPIDLENFDIEKAWDKLEGGEVVKEITQEFNSFLKEVNPHGEIRRIIKYSRIFLQKKIEEWEVNMSVNEFILEIYRSSDDIDRKFLWIYLKAMKSFFYRFPFQTYFEKILSLRYYKGVETVNEMNILLRFERFYLFKIYQLFSKGLFTELRKEIVTVIQNYQLGEEKLKSKSYLDKTALKSRLTSEELLSLDEIINNFFQDHLTAIYRLSDITSISDEGIDIFKQQLLEFDSQVYFNMVFEGILDDIKLSKERIEYKKILLYDLFMISHSLPTRPEVQRLYGIKEPEQDKIKRLSSPTNLGFFEEYSIPKYSKDIKTELIRKVDRIIP